jgi:dihydroflavonol-4-reductase
MEPQVVLVTGASGYIAKHIVHRLLAEGHAVRASVRNARRSAEVFEAATQDLADPSAAERFSVVELDLEADAGWKEALAGADALIHTASPFPLVQPKNPDDLIRPAVDGTMRALRAARSAGVRRVVMTSSVVAVTRTTLPAGRNRYDERDWSDLGGPISPYGKSKTLAEKAAWAFVETDGKGMDLTTINPGFVLGPPRDRRFGTSLGVIKRMLSGKDPAVPRVGYPVVDVRDIAAMHVAALTRPQASGKRILGASEFLWFSDMAQALKQAFPDRKIATRVAPDLLMRVIGLFDASVATILPELGQRAEVDNGRAREILGIDFIPARTSVVESARFLVDKNLA